MSGISVVPYGLCDGPFKSLLTNGGPVGSIATIAFTGLGLASSSSHPRGQPCECVIQIAGPI